jgi:hypothetical protein
MGLKVKHGVIQDATFITYDPGHARADKPRGDEAKTRRSRDGTWAKKGGKSFFGYKTHTKSVRTLALSGIKKQLGLRFMTARSISPKRVRLHTETGVILASSPKVTMPQ